jgi:hypothetical protein
LVTNSARALVEFYGCISQKLSIPDFMDKLAEFWRYETVERGFLSKIRLSKDPCKKLMDEVMPVARFLNLHNINTGLIRFPLDNSVPDCFLWRSGNDDPQKIEVTVAQGTVRFHHIENFIKNAESHGFLDLQDYASESEFNNSLTRDRECYSTDKVLKNIREGIIISLKKKRGSKYAGMTLLMSARLSIKILPYERWEELIIEDLLEATIGMPFKEIHVIGDDSEKPIGFRIK